MKADADLLKGIFSKRDERSNKGTFGQVTVIGGCVNYVGAPTFGAQSAEALTQALDAAYLKSGDFAKNSIKNQQETASRLIADEGLAAMLLGTGTTVLGIPDFLAQPLYSYVRFSSVYPLQSKNGYIVFDEETLQKLSKRTTAFLIGCGMGDGEADKYVEFILKNGNQPIVADADAIYKTKDVRLDKRVVLTPHIGEFASLTGKSVYEVSENQAEMCKNYAKSRGCTVVLKSHVTYISDGETVYENTSGNARLAKGGSGDVLGGVIAGLLSWGVQPLAAGAAGCYILGRAAELSSVNEFSHLPTDVIKKIPDVIDGILKL